MHSIVLISVGVTLENIVFAWSTAIDMEDSPHHSCPQEKEQKSPGEKPPNIAYLYCMQNR